MAYNVLTETLADEIVASDSEDRWLILAVSRDYPGYWTVQCLSPDYLLTFSELIGPHRVVSPAELPGLLALASETEYDVAFETDPLGILDAYERLNDVPEVTINSHFENTVNGLLPYQVQGYNALKDVEGAAALWTTGPQPLTEPVQTPNGWKEIGDLHPGNLVIGSDGRATEIHEILDQGDRPLWRVDFSDGSHTMCSPDHLWSVRYWTSGSRKGKSRSDRSEHRTITRSAIELRDMGLFVAPSGIKSGPRGRAKFSLPDLAPVVFTESEMIFDAYALGLLLGDGSLASGCSFSTADPELLESLKRAGGSIVHDSRYDYRVNGLRPILRSLGVYGCRSWEKFVPVAYLTASIDDRLALLQGLLDTDGCVSGSGASFTSTSLQLATDVVELCRSLGGHATCPVERTTSYTYKGVKRQGRPSYRVNLTLDMPLFRLARKESSRSPYRKKYKRIVGFTDMGGKIPMKCLVLDSPDHLYVTRGYALTHNSGKTVLATALILYHFAKGHSDACFFLVKANNKVNTQRWLKQLGDLDSIVIEGTKPQREKRYLEFYDALDEGRHPIAITNYEKFRDDFCWFEKSKKGDWMPRLHEWCEPIFNSDLFLIWDEAPTKLKTRSSKLYKAVCRSLYRTNAPAVDWSQRRSPGLRQLVLTATPVEIDPEDWFNCIASGTLVEGVGAIHSAYRARYKGDLYKLVLASGTQLTIGPNHPIFTDRGWVKAKLLTEGDNVFSRSIQRVSPAIEDVNKGSTRVEDLFDFIRETTDLVRMKRTSSFEFHGDGKFLEGEVEVVGANSLLPNVSDPQVIEQIGHSELGLAHSDTQGSLLCAGSFDKSLACILSPQSGDLPLDDSLGTEILQGATTNRNFHISESISNRFLADIQIAGDNGDGNIVLDISPSNRFEIQRDFRRVGWPSFDSSTQDPCTNSGRMYPDIVGDLGEGFAALVTSDEIIDIELIQDCDCHVFDLSTDSTTYYANGILVSNCERLINGGRTYGTVTAFRDRYAAAYDYFDENKVTAWRDLDDIALRASGIVHRVDKSHPDIAKQFPKVVQEVVEIDWEHNDYMAYQKVMKEMRKQVEDGDEEGEAPITILAAIGIGQMLCDAPEMVLNSAAVRETWDALEGDAHPEGSATALALCKALAGYRLTNKNHTKISTLQEILTIRHPTEKCLVYTIYNKAILPMMSGWLEEWNISHVIYAGTNAQKQDAEDRFKTDPSIRVFLSSDAGSDSLNLEVASVGINYDLPWNYSRYTQRLGRNERATSNFDTVYWYDLLMTHSVEMRRQKLIFKKRGYHEALTGRASAESQSARLTRDELLSILA
jgi:hypothetical protein